MLAQFVPFQLERLLSTWENRVEYNLSESGVHPMTARELLGDDVGLDASADVRLRYPQANGTRRLRERIAALYPRASAENVLVTVGAIGANFLAVAALTQPGETVAVLEPNYQQIWGLVQNFGRRLSTFRLQPELDWRIDRDELERATRPSARLVAIVNPNNPTGRVMSESERQAVVDTAAATGAWLLADEVYAGAERSNDAITATIYGEYDRVLAVNSMSKAYALPGLRIGWVVGPPEAIEAMWAWQDYATISAGMLDGELAAHALLAETRARIIARTRVYVRRGFAVLQDWASRRDDVQVIPNDAGAICLIRYRQPINSTELVMRAIEEQATLVAPGDIFGLDGYLRIGFGIPEDYLREGLRRIGLLLDAIR
jgi:aspartate/methionine/tyrosine aminotransferase